eukprot:scaffold5539_cov81-Skeletonema_menzelii.AAC.1
MAGSLNHGDGRLINIDLQISDPQLRRCLPKIPIGVGILYETCRAKFVQIRTFGEYNGHGNNKND